MITPKIIYYFLSGLIVTAVILYLGFQISAFAGSPILFIDLPLDLTIEQETIMIKGQTSRDAKVLINNQEIAVDEQGNFQEEIYLQPGSNILNFQAINSRDKITYAQRRIFRTTK
ncbi:MAG: hypothetical protein ABIG90_00800 [bacterium]